MDKNILLRLLPVSSDAELAPAGIRQRKGKLDVLDKYSE
jgi:hypothetical protein